MVQTNCFAERKFFETMSNSSLRIETLPIKHACIHAVTHRVTPKVIHKNGKDDGLGVERAYEDDQSILATSSHAGEVNEQI